MSIGRGHLRVVCPCEPSLDPRANWGCGRRDICPFCYGRVVEELTCRVFTLVDQQVADEQAPLDELFVYVLSSSAESRAKILQRSVTNRTVERAAHPLLVKIRKLSGTRGSAKLREMGVLAYHWRNSPRLRDGVFTVTNRLLVFADRPLAELPDERAYLVKKREEVVKPLSLHLRYDDFLLRDPAADVAWVLKRFERVLRMGTGGLLRGLAAALDPPLPDIANNAKQEDQDELQTATPNEQ